MANRQHDIITIEVQLKHETEKAYLVEAVDHDTEAWVPKSLVELSEKDKFGLCEMQIPEYLALDKGLI